MRQLFTSRRGKAAIISDYHQVLAPRIDKAAALNMTRLLSLIAYGDQRVAHTRSMPLISVSRCRQHDANISGSVAVWRGGNGVTLRRTR